MKILYSGGGTMGSVSPLIAIHQQLNKKNNVISNYKSLWLGTYKGPERKIIEKENIKFKPIISGKLRRYFDLRNILDLFKIKFGFWQAFFTILKFKPNIILSAGGFVSVPVVWAGWILRVPILIHQQDVRQGLANKLMSLFAKKITVALDTSLKNFSKKKTALVGNPVRNELIIMNYPPSPLKITTGLRRTGESGDKNLNKFKFKNNLPTILVTGGGTGASEINNLIWNNLNELIKFCNIIHLTGKNKNNKFIESEQYKSFEFLGNEIADVLNISDIVISRAGLSSLTELAYLKKPIIIIPIPNSHQEDNAEYFKNKNACIYLKQKELTSIKLVQEVKNLLNNKNKQKELSKNINKIFVDYSGEKIVSEIIKLTN